MQRATFFTAPPGRLSPVKLDSTKSGIAKPAIRLLKSATFIKQSVDQNRVPYYPAAYHPVPHHPVAYHPLPVT